VYLIEIEKLVDDYSHASTFYNISWTLSTANINKDVKEEKALFKDAYCPNGWG
jgi:hypothetical protein